MKIVHICAGWQEWNGAANIARMIAGEQERSGNEPILRIWTTVGALLNADEVWVHCAWMPCLWWAALWAKRLVWMPEASYDPVRLRYREWKKRLVGVIERFFLRKAAVVVATCEAEADWIRSYEPKVKRIEVTDIRRFFDLKYRDEAIKRGEGRLLHLLYLGRRHPLKGVEFLEAAVAELKKGLELRMVNDAFGEEKERVWAWCDVLVLPTLSENFGLVVAEALERGKRVITTDGAPVWDPGMLENGVGVGCGGQLLYLKGFRDGTRDDRIRLLKEAIQMVDHEIAH